MFIRHGGRHRYDGDPDICLGVVSQCTADLSNFF